MNFTKTAITALTVLTLTSLTLTACDAEKSSQSVTTTHVSPTTVTASATISTPITEAASSVTTAAKTQGVWIDVREADEYAHLFSKSYTLLELAKKFL